MTANYYFLPQWNFRLRRASWPLIGLVADVYLYGTSWLKKADELLRWESILSYEGYSRPLHMYMKSISFVRDGTSWLASVVSYSWLPSSARTHTHLYLYVLGRIQLVAPCWGDRRNCLCSPAGISSSQSVSESRFMRMSHFLRLPVSCSEVFSAASWHRALVVN